MTVEFKRLFRIIGFRFDALSVLLLCQHFSIDLSEIEKIPAAEYIPAWCWCAHRSYQMYKRKKDKLTLIKTKKFIARMRKEEWDRMLEAIHSTQVSKKKAEEASAGGNY